MTIWFGFAIRLLVTWLATEFQPTVTYSLRVARLRKLWSSYWKLQTPQERRLAASLIARMTTKVVQGVTRLEGLWLPEQLS